MTFSLRRCLCLLLLLCTAACRERIQHGLDERQANELQTVLAERGLDARKVPEAGKKPTWAIEVDEAQASDAVRILAELGLPRPVEETGCDVFGGGGLIRSPVNTLFGKKPFTSKPFPTQCAGGGAMIFSTLFVEVVRFVSVFIRSLLDFLCELCDFAGNLSRQTQGHKAITRSLAI